MANLLLHRNQSRLFQPKEFQQVSHYPLLVVKPRSKVTSVVCKCPLLLISVFDTNLEAEMEETSKQMEHLQTPGATPRASSPSGRESTPVSTPKS